MVVLLVGTKNAVFRPDQQTSGDGAVAWCAVLTDAPLSISHMGRNGCGTAKNPTVWVLDTWA